MEDKTDLSKDRADQSRKGTPLNLKYNPHYFSLSTAITAILLIPGVKG
jgi:hypothetical protein